MGYYGLVMRKTSCTEKEIIQGCTNGNRSRGRQRWQWIEDINDWTGLRITDAIDEAMNTERAGAMFCRTRALDDDDDDDDNDGIRLL